MGEMLPVVIQLVFLVFIFKYVSDIVLVIWCAKVYGVPYAPTKMGQVREMVEGLKLKKGTKVVELGSGDGRVSVEIAKRYPVKVLGVELNRWLLFWSRVRAGLTLFKKGEVRFERKDLFKVRLEDYEVVYMYLLPRMLKELEGEFNKMKKGSLVISWDYPVESKRLKLEREIEGRKRMRVYRVG